MIETISPLGADNRFIPDQVNEDDVSLWVKVGQVGLQTSHRTGGFLALTQTYSNWAHFHMAPVEFERQGNQCKLEVQIACCVTSCLTNIKTWQVNLLICK